MFVVYVTEPRRVAGYGDSIEEAMTDAVNRYKEDCLFLYPGIATKSLANELTKTSDPMSVECTVVGLVRNLYVLGTKEDFDKALEMWDSNLDWRYRGQYQWVLFDDGCPIYAMGRSVREVLQDYIQYDHSLTIEELFEGILDGKIRLGLATKELQEEIERSSGEVLYRITDEISCFPVLEPYEKD